MSRGEQEKDEKASTAQAITTLQALHGTFYLGYVNALVKHVADMAGDDDSSRWAIDDNNSEQACAMIVLDDFPKNKDKYLRLIEFCKGVLDICSVLGIFPILNGSLAVFAYTKNQDMQVNDIDLACSETEFPKIISALEARGISCKLKEWHVLQILKDDLKVELDSIEYWYKDLSMVVETLQIDHHRVSMLNLNSLKEFYRRGMEDTANKTEENERKKNEAIKGKYEALEKVKG